MIHTIRSIVPPVITRFLYNHFRRTKYYNDGMILYDRNISFLNEPRFRESYQKGMASGHRIGGGGDLGIEWRVYIACWAAMQVLPLEGEFVECGVNTGMMSLAICNYLDFNSVNKWFYLFDTYEGIPVEQTRTHKEREHAVGHNGLDYFPCYDIARRNFAPYTNTVLVKGRVPESLNRANIGQVSYLSIDMNIEAPERASLEFFWDKLVKGGIILLDDYGFRGYELQHESANEFAKKVGRTILPIPTGQGLLIK